LAEKRQCWFRHRGGVLILGGEADPELRPWMVGRLAREHEPVSDLVTVLTLGLITADFYDATFDTMAKTGYES